MESGALDALDVVQTVGGIATTTCPIRFDGAVLHNPTAAPALGAHTHAVLAAIPQSNSGAA